MKREKFKTKINCQINCRIQKYGILTKHSSLLFNYLVMLFVLTSVKWSLNQNLKRPTIQDFHEIRNWFRLPHLHHQNFRPHRLNHLVSLLFLKLKNHNIKQHVLIHFVWEVHAIWSPISNSLTTNAWQILCYV